jgi:hypothetical protein
MKRIVLLGILGAIAAGAYFAIKLLPWWAILLAFIGLVVGGKFLVGRLLRKLILLPFKAKGAVLRGATARVNSVVPAGPVSESAADRSVYDLDVTITPTPSSGPFGHWEPGELRLVRTDCKIDLDDANDDDACQIDNVEVQQDGQFQPDEGMKYPGEQRLKLRVAIAPGTDTLKFRYYFEEFGEVRFDTIATLAA